MTPASAVSNVETNDLWNDLQPLLDYELSRLGDKYHSKARFALGSFLPTGYAYRDVKGDPRLGTLMHGTSAYPQLGRSLADFDIVFAYPWGGESGVLEDLMKRYGRRDARLLLYGTDRGFGSAVTRC